MDWTCWYSWFVDQLLFCFCGVRIQSSNSRVSRTRNRRSPHFCVAAVVSEAVLQRRPQRRHHRHHRHRHRQSDCFSRAAFFLSSSSCPIFVCLFSFADVDRPSYSIESYSIDYRLKLNIVCVKRNCAVRGD